MLGVGVGVPFDFYHWILTPTLTPDLTQNLIEPNVLNSLGVGDGVGDGVGASGGCLGGWLMGGWLMGGWLMGGWWVSSRECNNIIHDCHWIYASLFEHSWNVIKQVVNLHNEHE